MIRRRAAQFRLYPTPDQSAEMTRIAGACRFVYNLALEQRRDWYRPGRHFDYKSQCLEVTELRAEVDWLKAAPVHTLQQALRDLQQAYKNWWAGRAGAPTPRRKGQHDSFRFPDPKQVQVERTGRSSGRIKVPKLGWIKLRGWRDLPGDICTITISRRAGKWCAAVQCEREIVAPSPSTLPDLGGDLGVSTFLATSEGVLVAPVNRGKKAHKALGKAQQDLSRKKKGSANRRKAVIKVQRLHQKVADARKDFAHKTSTTVAKNHGTVFVEGVKVKNMTRSARGTRAKPGRRVRQKAGLNGSILDQGWGMFRGMLVYKLEERGGRLIEVNPAYTSQTCSACGAVDAASRDGRAFACVACGHAANADVNAAKVILQRGRVTSLKPVEGHRGRRPDEAGTSRWAA